MTSDAFTGGLRSVLRTTANAVELLTSPSVWIPGDGSAGQAEVTNSESGPAGPWGERPVRTAYAAACMGIKEAAEYGRSMEAVATPAFSPLVPETIARGAIEAAASAWWLLEPGLGARRRVCRLLLALIKSAMELERAVAEIGESNADGAFGDTLDQVRDYSQQLGLGPFTDRGGNRAAICEREIRPGYTERVKALLDASGVKGAYNIYSGTAHAELYAVRRLFAVGPAESDPEPIRMLAFNATGLHRAVDLVLRAMIEPLQRAGLLFGWHGDAEPGATLSALIDHVIEQMAGLDPGPQ